VASSARSATTSRRSVGRSRRSSAAATPLLTDPATSQRLGRVLQKNTTPELVVRQLLHQLGARFRVGGKGLPGRPDVVNVTRRWAVFVHGCFWHGHHGCVKATVPKRNRAFWTEKFDQNRARDRRTAAALRRAGFRVFVVWECETADLPRLERRLIRFFERRRAATEAFAVGSPRRSGG
jgi:DNA mismatch endonuclease (patch repair protein)